MKRDPAIYSLAAHAASALGSSALGQRMIAVDSSRALFDIDLATGAKTQFGSVSSNAGTTGGLA